jgi:hypothetical protein
LGVHLHSPEDLESREGTVSRADGVAENAKADHEREPTSVRWVCRGEE